MRTLPIAQVLLRSVMLLIALPTILSAQAVQRGELTGLVWDTVSGAPVTRGHVLIDGNIVARLGRGGTFRIASLPDSPFVTLKVWCRTGGIFATTIVERRLTVPPDSSWIELAVDGSKCDLRPLVEITGTFVGWYTGGIREQQVRPVWRR